MVLEGRTVRLVPLVLDLVPDLVAAASEDRSTYGFTNVPADEVAMTAYVESALAAPDQYGFATCTATDGRVVGSTRFGSLEWWPSSSRSEPDVAEIGWTWLAASAQRSAVNTEAKLLMLTHAFEVWHVARLQLKTDALNSRSRAAIERIGARFEGVLRRQTPAFGRPGPRDSAMYSIVPDEWPEVKAGLMARL